jgi:hypothetical protein
MLQEVNNQKDDDYQDAKYTTAKFELITPLESPSAALLLHIIQSLYHTKTSKQDLAYRHNNAFERTPKQNLAYRHDNAFKSASIRILDARERGINYGILDVHQCNIDCGILDIYRYNTNYRILNAHWCNDFLKILNALKI